MTMRLTGIVLLATFTACGEEAPGSRTPAPPVRGDVVPPGEDADGDTDEPMPPPVGDTSVCGNGSLDGAELCDADTVACATLASVWSSGSATCRADCSGYDVRTCTRSSQANETVRPAERSTRWKDALCNDGTSFAFHVSLASEPTTIWVIYLEGGGRCDGTYSSCVGRPLPFISSRNEADDGQPVAAPRNRDTFMSRDPSINPTFHAANFAYGRYCSSDLWSGTNTTPRAVAWKKDAAPVPFVFTGHNNVVALVETLFQAYGLDDTTSYVLFAGSSAGSAGAQRQLHVIGQRLPLAIADKRFALLLGSAFRTGTFDYPGYPFKGGAMSADDLFEAIDVIYASDVDPKCTAAAHRSGLGSSTCGPSPFAYKVATDAPPLGWGVRAMVAMNRLDQNAMGDYDLPIVSACTPNDIAAREAYADDMTSAMDPIPWLYAPADPQTSPADENLHGLIIDPQVWLYAAPNQDNLSLRDLVSELWSAPTSGRTNGRLVFEGSVPHASDAPF